MSVPDHLTGSLFSYAEAPAEWFTLADDSWFNLTADPACFHYKHEGHDWYCKLYGVTELASSGSLYSASAALWDLINSGSDYEWRKLY